MTSSMYTPVLKKFLDADADLLAANIKCVLVDTADYTFSAAHEFLSDIAAGARVATSGNLANKTTTGGVFDADDITISAVTGDPIEAVVIYVDTGTATTSALICYIDNGGALTFTPNGGDVTLQFSSGSNKIFKFG